MVNKKAKIDKPAPASDQNIDFNMELVPQLRTTARKTRPCKATRTPYKATNEGQMVESLPEVLGLVP